MEPLSQIFESLKSKSVKSNFVKARTETKKTALSNKLSTIKDDRLKRVTEALNAKKEENKNKKTIKESSNVKTLKRSIALSRKFESLKRNANVKALDKNTRLEAILKKADEEKIVDDSKDKRCKNCNKHERPERETKCKGECGLKSRKECDTKINKKRRESDEERDEFLRRERKNAISRIESLRRPDTDENREKNLRTRREWKTRRDDSRRRRESSLADIERAEARFFDDLEDDRFETRRHESRRFRTRYC